MLQRIPGIFGRLGTAARRNVGTGAGQVPVLDSSGRLPAVDGSQLTGITTSVADDLELTIAELALNQADLLNTVAFLGGSGNRVADSFDTLTQVDDENATNLDTGTPGVLKPQGVLTTQTVVNNGTTSGLPNDYTIFDRSVALTGGDVIHKIGVYSPAAASMTVKIALRNSTANYTVVVTQAVTHAGGGWQDFTLASPYTVPGSGSYYVGAYSPTVSWTDHGSAANRGFISGNATGTSGGWTEDSGPRVAMRVLKNPSGAQNMTVASVVLPADDVPNSARCVAQVKEIDSISLNTDLVFSVTRDGGATWTAFTMTKKYTVNDISVYDSDTVSLASQGSDTDMKWKIESDNGKNFEVHGIYLYWK